MKLRILTLVAFVAVWACPALAQQTTAPQTPAPQLNPMQTEGRATFSKSCSICHLSPQFGASTYGPRLNQASLGGNEQVMRQIISEGTPRMPAFKHMYKPAQVDAIIAYLKTVPAPPPAPTPATSQSR